MRDWEMARKAYAEQGLGLREVAERFAIPYSTLCARAAREDWAGRAAPQRQAEIDRISRKLLARLESALDEGREIDLKELKTVTGALRELQSLQDEREAGSGTLTVRFMGEAEEMSI